MFCITNYLGVYNDNLNKLNLPLWINFVALFPLSFFFINKFYDNILYYDCGLINHYPEIDTILFSPVIFSIKIVDSSGNKVDVRNIFQSYKISVPLDVIIHFESLIGEFIEIQIFNENVLKNLKINLKEDLTDSFGNIIQDKLSQLKEKEDKNLDELEDNEEYDFC